MARWGANMLRKRRLTFESLEQRRLLDGSPFPQAISIPLTAAGIGSQSAKILHAGDIGTFKFTSPLTGTLVARELSGPGTSAFPTVFTVYDSAGNPISSLYSNVYPPQTYTTLCAISATKNSIYYAKVAGQGTTTGSYSIQITPDDVGDTFALASPIALLAANGAGQPGSASRSAKIDFSGDADIYSFTATVTGSLTIVQSPAAGSAVSSSLTVYNGGQAPIAQSGAPGTSKASVTIPVLAGVSYFVKSAAFVNTTGAYSMQISTVASGATVGHTFATATPIVITPDPTNLGLVTTQKYALGFAGDVDYYSFVAATTGQMTIRQFADTSLGSKLDSYLYIYDANQNLLWQNDNSGGTLNSQITVSVVAGTTYYAKTTGRDGSIGAYVLSFVTVAAATDIPGTFAKPVTITLASDGTSKTAGAIDYIGDYDIYTFTPLDNGPLFFRLTTVSGSLKGQATFYYADASGNPVSDSNQTLLATGDFQDILILGKTYYLKVSGVGLTAGSYVLQSYYPPQPPPPADNQYNITLNIRGATAQETKIIQDAAKKWESIITSDLPAVNYKGKWIDDNYIEFTIEYIDGPGGILGGSQSPDVRPRSNMLGSGLPYHSKIIFDTADVNQMVTDGQFFTVALHEMGHSIGFGSIWSSFNVLTGTATLNPRFIGTNASREYHKLFTKDTTPGVPVEAFGGPGTALAHWREDVMGSELMTGYLLPQDSLNTGWPLSKVTVGSFQDLGYGVNYAKADTYIALPPLAIKSSTTTATPTRGLLIQTSWSRDVGSEPSGSTGMSGSTLSQYARDAALSSESSTAPTDGQHDNQFSNTDSTIWNRRLSGSDLPATKRSTPLDLHRRQDLGAPLVDAAMLTYDDTLEA
jgi:hypothetical protein